MRSVFTREQIAQTDRTRLSMGRDGKYYKMLDSRDWGLFHVLSDEEMQEEIRRSVEIKENMMTLTGQFKDGHYKEAPKSIKFVPPQMGTASKSRKIERRRWQKDMKAMKSGDLSGTSKAMQDVDSDYSKTMRALAANTEQEDIERDEGPRAFDFTENVPENRVTQAFNVIQKKYEQNLHVVERLYNEKLSLEEYARSLERELRRGRNRPIAPKQSDDESETRSERDYRLRTSTLAPPKYEEVLEIEREYGYNDDRNEERPETTGVRRGRPLNRTSPAALNASAPSSLRSHSAPRHSMGRSLEAGRESRSSEPRAHSASRRNDRSESRARSIEGGVSANLLADADRYVQKRRLLEERERLQKLEEERYLLSLKEKQQRASLNGKAFDDMFRRQEEARRKNEEKKKKAHEEEILKKKQARADEKEKQREKELRMITALKSGTSWRELQDIEEQQRKERIEKRKQELVMISALPRSIEENINRSNSKKAVAAELQAVLVNDQASKAAFRAEDPAKVAMRLRKQREAWKRKEEEEEENRKLKELQEKELAASRGGSRQSSPSRSRNLSRRGSASGGSGVLSASGGAAATSKMLPMEIRAEESRARREASAKARKEAEDKEKAKKAAEEKAKRDRILNAKLPESALVETKAVTKRMEKLKKEKEEEAEQKRKEEEREKRKQRAMKEASAMVSIALKDREEELKSKNPKLFEISTTEALAAERAAEAREEYRRKLRENKQRLRESLKNRPSLLQRHDESMASKTAATSALKKVARAVHEVEQHYGNDEDDLDAILGGGKGKPSTGKTHGTDQIFSAKEKMVLAADS